VGTGRGQDFGYIRRERVVALEVKQNRRTDDMFDLKYNHIHYVHCKYVNYCK